MTPQQLKQSILDIRLVMDKKVGLEDPVGVADKLNSLSNLLGLSSECIAWARKYYDEKLGTLVMSPEFKGMSATDKKMFFAMKSSDEIYLVNYAESLNKDLHYCIESLRTLISYLKQEMAQTQRI